LVGSYVVDEVDAPLIVCGAGGLNPVKRAILGSVSEAVLHHSHRPITQDRALTVLLSRRS
jgi:nucleotide-binding universal stress UspA family protein